MNLIHFLLLVLVASPDKEPPKEANIEAKAAYFTIIHHNST
jgi:hypothetical protein